MYFFIYVFACSNIYIFIRSSIYVLAFSTSSTFGLFRVGCFSPTALFVTILTFLSEERTFHYFSPFKLFFYAFRALFYLLSSTTLTVLKISYWYLFLSLLFLWQHERLPFNIYSTQYDFFMSSLPHSITFHFCDILNSSPLYPQILKLWITFSSFSTEQFILLISIR